MTTLTITSTKQGMAYDETTAVAAFSVLEGLVAFAAKLLLAVQPGTFSLSRPVRLVRA